MITVSWGEHVSGKWKPALRVVVPSSRDIQRNYAVAFANLVEAQRKNAGCLSATEQSIATGLTTRTPSGNVSRKNNLSMRAIAVAGNSYQVAPTRKKKPSSRMSPETDANPASSISSTNRNRSLVFVHALNS